MRSVLENLPNELIIEIFGYSKIRDLSFGLWNLNKRFNALIRSLKYLSLILTKDCTSEELLFSEQIIRMVIVTLESINLNPFINLRSLVLNLATENHLKQIQSIVLPNLVYLSLPLSFDSRSTKQLASEVFSNRFSSLRFADLGVIDMPSNLSWSQSPSLRSIRIFSPNINIIPLILQSCTQLTHFQVRITGEHPLDIPSLPIISNHPLKQFIFLQAQHSTIAFNIANIIYLIPNVKQLDLRLCTISFIDLIKLISKYLIKLNRFDCHIIEFPNKDETIDINVLRKIHPCYSGIQYLIKMSHTIKQLEDLPNEILTEIFEYIDATNLFRIFSNLNGRLNKILKSLHTLHLSLTTTDSHQIGAYNRIAPHIKILCIYGLAQLNLKYFTNIRRLILIQASDELVEQLQVIRLKSLEHLTIILDNRQEEDRLAYFWNRIFIYDYPALVSCCLYKIILKWTNSQWRIMPSLSILKIGDIDLLIYESILSSCPNLYFFKFTRLTSKYQSKTIRQHLNLKKLVIVMPRFEDLSHDCHSYKYFSYVPKLEQLIVHRTNESKSISEAYFKFDWYITSINQYLPSLSRFVYYFHILKSDRLVNATTQNRFEQIQANFNLTHRLYQRRLILDFIG
ncbi:unnamed protein product [Rotaria magnacalcarata]|uniref:F-box domain-containing protein n=3 Tax=Rotaria magnacalcarata TaxID=392030 RepID=A0A819IV51_9BILA|nr:unnamed protein product [Rotaria magnacalcarata]